MKEVKDNPGGRDERWRIFCAVDLPERSRRRVIDHISRLRALLPEVPVSWSREGAIHLTLKFVGEIPKDAVAGFADAVSRAVEGVAPFPIVLERTGGFPRRREPRVLWIGITDREERLAELHSRLEIESERNGFPRESRAFHPHLTIARLRRPHPAAEIVEVHERLRFEPEEIPILELLVIRSELSSAGSKYTVLSKHPLGHSG